MWRKRVYILILIISYYLRILLTKNLVIKNIKDYLEKNPSGYIFKAILIAWLFRLVISSAQLIVSPSDSLISSYIFFTYL